MKISTCSVSYKNLCTSTTFSKTHKQTCHLHFWIARDLIYKGKLLRSETNSQISSNLHFSYPFTPFFDKPICSEFPVPLYYSKSLDGSTSHFKCESSRSRLGARGKPSTFVYRAGWLVEPFRIRSATISSQEISLDVSLFLAHLLALNHSLTTWKCRKM